MESAKSIHEGNLEFYLERRKKYGTKKYDWKICNLIALKYYLKIKTRGWSALELAFKISVALRDKLTENEGNFIKEILGDAIKNERGI